MSNVGGRNERLAALLCEAQWSAAELARAIVDQAAAQGLAISYDRTAPAHWLNGTRPRHPTPQLAAEAFTKRLRRLVTASDTGLINEERATEQPHVHIPLGASPPEAIQELVTLCRTALAPEHGPILARSLYTSTPLTTTPWTAPRIALPTSTSRAGPMVLGDLAHTLSNLWTRHGGGQTRPLILSYVAHCVRPEYLGEQPELLAGYAQFAYLAAVTCVDCGQHGMAQRLFDTALRLSHYCGARELGAVTLRAMSSHALSLNYRDHAVDTAQQAVDLATAHASGAVRSFVLAQRAVAFAAAGKATDAARDVTLMVRAWGEGNARPGPFTTYPRSALDFQRSQVWRLLGEKDRAQASLHDALRWRSPVQRRPYALLHASLGEVTCEVGRIEAACRHWGIFVDHYPYVWSTAMERALARMSSRLAPFADHKMVRRLLGKAAALAAGV